MLKDAEQLLQTKGWSFCVKDMNLMAAPWIHGTISYEGKDIPRKQHMKCLGIKISADATYDDDIKDNIEQGWNIFWMLSRFLLKRNTSRARRAAFL